MQRVHRGRVGEAFLRIGMHLHKKRIYSDRCGGPREMRNILPGAARLRPSPARPLHTMGRIEAYGIAELAQLRKRSHVDHECAVAEARPSLGQYDLLVPG